MRQPRQYQIDAVRSVRAAFEAKKRGAAIELPTGTGKGFIIGLLAKMACAKNYRVLIMVNRDNLCEQLFESCVEQGLMPRFERGDDNCSPLAALVVGSVQTMAMGNRVEKWNPSHFQLVITDEIHFAAAKTFRKVLDYFKSARHVGVTATLARHDGKGIWPGYEDCSDLHPFNASSAAFCMTLKEATMDGWLVPHNRIELPVPIQLTETEDKMKWTDKEQGEYFSAKHYLPRLFAACADKCQGMTALNFWPNCDSSREADKHFKLHGIDSMHIDGYMSDKQIAKVKEWFKDGGAKTCHCADYFSYGYDNPHINCVGLMRICKSIPMTKQRIGRGTRPDCVVDGLGDASARRVAIATSRKPEFYIWDLMLQLDGLDKMYADATCLITEDTGEMDAIRQGERVAGHSLSQEEMEELIKSHKATDAEAQTRKLAEQAANAARRKKKEEKYGTVYIADILKAHNAAHKPATSGMIQEIKSWGVVIPQWATAISMSQYFRIKERTRKK